MMTPFTRHPRVHRCIALLLLLVLAALPSYPARAARIEAATWAQQARLLASDGAQSDSFGSALASGGDLIATTTSNTVYLLVRPASGWAADVQPVAQLVLPGFNADNVALALALEGDTVVVGAPGKDAAYVFVRPAAGWSGLIAPVATLQLADPAPSFFGESVAIAGDTVVVGANGVDVESAAVFVRPADGWSGTLTPNATLTAADSSPNNRFGASIAIDDTTVVIGAPEANSYLGAAYVFTKPADGWSGTRTESATLVPTGGQGGRLGEAVAIDGATVVVGAPTDNTLGAAYVFQPPAGGWSGAVGQQAKLLGDEGQSRVGEAVAVRGAIVAVGAPGEFSPAQPGVVYTFVEPDAWSGVRSPTARVMPSDGANRDQFGYKVALNGTQITVGAPNTTIGANVNQGAAYVFAQRTTMVEVTSTPSRSQIGQAVTLTATISSAQAPPRGYLTFLRNGTQRLGTVALDAQGRASLTVRDLPLGEHAISIEYSGDINFDVSLSTVLTQTVGPATLHLPLVAR